MDAAIKMDVHKSYRNKDRWTDATKRDDRWGIEGQRWVQTQTDSD